MGFGLPSALGAAAAFDGKDGRPSKVVVDIDGDGRWVLRWLQWGGMRVAHALWLWLPPVPLLARTHSAGPRS